jgi:hypothetical protein
MSVQEMVVQGKMAAKKDVITSLPVRLVGISALFVGIEAP